MEKKALLINIYQVMLCCLVTPLTHQSQKLINIHEAKRSPYDDWLIRQVISSARLHSSESGRPTGGTPHSIINIHELILQHSMIG